MLRLSESTACRRTGALTTLVISLVATVGLVGCMPAAATDVRVRHTLFGMHDATSSSYAQIDEGAVRLWDVGVQWRDIERTKGHYTWARLDDLVTAAQQAHAEVTMVVAMTPSFYASAPTRPPRSLTPYRHFVKALMKRYKNFHGTRGIAAYQVWNEANIGTFYTGSMARLASMTKAMHAVRNHVDKRAKVVAPGMVTRLDYQLKAMAEYYHQKVGGKRVFRYVDAVALSLYPLPTYGHRRGVPEDTVKQLKVVKRVLHRAHVPASKAIWNTEINYGLNTGSKAGTAASRITPARQAANVMRTYLLSAATGVKRVFWYRYDWPQIPGGGTIGNTLLTDPDNTAQVTKAGRAYARAQVWMHGTLLGSRGHRPCPKDRHGTYRCVVKDSSGKRYIYWNPFRSAGVRVPKGVHHLEGVLGGKSPVTPRSKLKVGFKPVMVH
jgi:hypothetical protein